MTEEADEVPAKFYKYRSMNGDAMKWVERTVLHNEIYFPPASAFNDPFDLRPVFTLKATPEKQRDDFLRMSKKFEPHLSEEQHAAAADKVMATSMSADGIGTTTSTIQAVHSHFIINAVGVLCVSTKPDDILMWSHYADSHSGISLEFDGTLPFMAHAQKVKYAHERVPINPYSDVPVVAMEKALLTKSEHWAYESEWRLCRYEEGPGIVGFRPNNLTGIIIGALASPTTIDTVKTWAQKRSVPLNIYQASVSPKNFEILIKRMQVSTQPAHPSEKH